MKTVYDKYFPSHENYYIDKTIDLTKASIRINMNALKINKSFFSVTVRDDLLNKYSGIEDYDSGD